MNEDNSLRKFESRATFSTWIGVVLLFAFFGLLALVVIGAAPRGTDYENKRATARAEKLKTTQDGTTTALTTYGWVDKNKGVAHIPINDAMKLTLAELAQTKPASAYPIATPEAQAPAQQTAGSASPAPSPSPAANSSATPKASTVTGPNSENRGQPAAADNPPAVAPGTQPGSSAKPVASPSSGAAKPQPAQSPLTTPSPSAPGTPLPVRGKTP